MNSLITTILIFFLTAVSNFAQTTNSKYVVTDKSSFKITGTSTLHDWDADVKGIQSTIDFNADALSGDTQTSPVSSLSLTIPVKNIKGDRGGMNGKIYDALKVKKHPNIIFTLTKAELINSENGSSISPSDFELTVAGNLNIAGVSRDVSFPVEGQLQSDGTYKFTGKYQIDMTDYNVDPPSAIFGTIKSGKDVTVSFDIFVAQQ